MLPPPAPDPALGTAAPWGATTALAQGWLLSPCCRDTSSCPDTYRSCNLPAEMLLYLLDLICSLYLENLSTLTPGFFHLARDPAPLIFSSSSMLAPSQCFLGALCLFRLLLAPTPAGSRALCCGGCRAGPLRGAAVLDGGIWDSQ